MLEQQITGSTTKFIILLTIVYFLVQKINIPFSISHSTIVAPHFAKETAKFLPSPPPPPEKRLKIKQQSNFK